MDWNEFIDENGCARIPEGIEKIPANAFFRNKRLRSAIIPEGVIEIGDDTFNGCENLEKIVLPKSLKKIGEATFISCEMLDHVSLPNSLNYLGRDAFHNCMSLTEINIPDGIEVIEPWTFRSCDKLSQVSLPQSLRKICDLAFCGCNIRSITIPDGVVTIEHNPFAGNKYLKSISTGGNEHFKFVGGCLMTMDGKRLITGTRRSVISEGVKTIGGCAFEGATMKSISFPESVVRIEPFAFVRSNLEEVRLPRHLKYVGDCAFSSCKRLKYVYIPKSLKPFSPEVFFEAFSLQTVEVHEDNRELRSDGGCVLSKDGKKLFLSPEGSAVPEGVVEFCRDCFCCRKKFPEVILPTSLEKMGSFGPDFLGRELFIPDGVKEVGDDSFSGSDRLLQIRLPETLNSIELFAFSWCNRLKKVVIPASVQKVNKAFQSCSSLSDVTIMNERMELAKGTFCCCPKLSHIRLMSNDPEVCAEILNAILSLEGVRDDQITLHVPGKAVTAFRTYTFTKKLKKVVAL